MGPLRLHPAIILLCLLSGCVAASQTLSGSSTERELLPLSKSSLDTIQIGVTKQEEIQALFGLPSDIQVLRTVDGLHESWAYVDTDKARQPFQYLPIFGALSTLNRDGQSPLAISFSPEGIVDGVTLSRVNAQGDVTYSPRALDSVALTPLYGMKNPLAQTISR